MTKPIRTRILPLVISALAIFAGLRAASLWVGFSSAGASDDAAMAHLARDDAEDVATPSDDVAPLSQPLRQSEIERRILERLAERSKALDAREREIETRGAVIAAAEKKLETRIASYQEERARLDALRAAQSSSETEELENLISAYEKMKAKDAARIFDALDEEILVPVAAGMRTQALAGVLAEMTPDNARRLTGLLAARSKLASVTASDVN